MMETTTEDTSEPTVVSGATVVAIDAACVATSYTETLMKYKLMIRYRTGSKNKAVTTAMMIMLMTKSLIGWCLNKAT